MQSCDWNRGHEGKGPRIPLVHHKLRYLQEVLEKQGLDNDVANGASDEGGVWSGDGSEKAAE